MTDSTIVEANDTSLTTDSRMIDDNVSANALGRGVHLPEGEQKQEDSKPLSTREAIAKAFDENTKTVEDKANAAAEAAKTKVEEAEAKPAKAEKTRADDGKFAKADTTVEVKADKSAPEQAAAERSAPEDHRQSEGRKYSEPPARFLPESRQKWANVPNEVKAEFHRITQEMETETAKYRQSHEAYEAVRQFDEMAKSSGTDLKTALQSYTNIENMLRSDPVRGVAEVLKNIGLTPQQYAQHVMQNPQAHQFQPQAQQPAHTQQQSNPEIEALRTEINSMKQQAIIPEIERFYEAHSITPGSDIEKSIADVLESGVIEKIYGNGLSLTQRLSEAYRMAGGQAPSRFEPEVSAAPVPVNQQSRPVDPDGAKSIKGAPTSGQTGEPAKRFKSNREALTAAFDAYAR
jgi:hypothetical protein